jgi:RyR domain
VRGLTPRLPIQSCAAAGIDTARRRRRVSHSRCRRRCDVAKQRTLDGPLHVIVQLMWGGSVEPIAQAIHERWRSEQISAGKPAPSWEQLDESRKESSRDQARDIPVKLHLVSSDIAALQERAAKASAEHRRWMRERIADGGTAGDKDVTRKTTPYLVPFEELPADIAECDRIFVREIPRLLITAGLQVVCTPTTSRPVFAD